MKRLCALFLLLGIGVSLFASELSDGSSYGAVAIAASGDLPSGYFSKAQHYLPGDNIAVTNPSSGVTINVLNLGTLEEGDAVLLLTPEAAAKLGVTASSSLRVKVSRRPDNFDDIASGIAILSYGGDLIAEAPAQSSRPAPATQVQPAPAAEVQPAPADDYADDGEDEFADLWNSEIPAEEDAKSASSGESGDDRVEIGGVELPDFGSAKVQPFPGMEDVGREPSSGLAQEERAEPLTTPEEEIPEEPYVVEESPLEHIAGEPAVPADRPRPAVEEELYPDVVPPDVEETVLAPPVVQEELLADASLPVVEELPPRQEREAELDENIIDGTAVPPATSGSAVTREPEVQVVAGADDDTEYDEVTETVETVEKETAIVLVPTKPVVPPPSAGDAGKKPAPAKKEPAPAEASPQKTVPPAPSAGSSKVRVLKSESALKKNAYDVQVATVSKLQNGEKIAADHAKYPIVLVELAGGKGYKVLVGPLTADEYGAILEKFKAFGFKDAFIKRIK